MPSLFDGVSVLIATPTTRDFPLQTVRSYLDTQEACFNYGLKADFAFFTGSLPHHARTLAANHFLASDHNLLFFTDSDIDWSPVDFMKVVLHMQKHDCIAGVYPRRQDPTGYFVKFTHDKPEPNEEGLVEIDATGMGFCCIKRGVIEHLSALAPKLRFGTSLEAVPSIFRCDDDGTNARGEDFAFWADVRGAGYRIFADATISLGHIGQKVYRRSGSSQIHTSG